MRLRLCAPTRVVVDEEVARIVVEATAGSFCMLPRHADLVATLVPGLLSYVVDGDETFVAVDGGTVVKCGDDVRVSTPQAVTGPRLDRIHGAVREDFRERGERELGARAALARLEADVLQTTLELDEREG